MQYKYLYDEQKNLKLKEERGVCFDDVIAAISSGKILDIIPHHNKKEYPNQMILIIEINDYAYLVPYLEEEDLLVLKTVFPSRKIGPRVWAYCRARLAWTMAACNLLARWSLEIDDENMVPLSIAEFGL